MRDYIGFVGQVTYVILEYDSSDVNGLCFGRLLFTWSVDRLTEPDFILSFV